MSKFKAMKFWIGDDPKCSERVQKVLFDMGYVWNTGSTKIQDLHYKEIQAWKDGSITRSDHEFNSFPNGFEEGAYINIDWLRTPKQETIELNGKKYIKADLADKLGEQSLIALEEALKHINPVD